jgi:uncharacterized phiE125 gp8 family phage protein
MLAIPIAGPAVEPVTTAELQSVLRLDDDTEDAFLGTLITAARRHVEDLSGRRLIQQSWRLTLDGWPPGRVVTIPLAPVLRIERVRLFDAQGQPLDLAAALYRLDRLDPPSVRIDPAAAGPAQAHDGIAIDIVAGYGATAADVPPPLVQAIRLLVARWFEHRGDTSAPLPDDVSALIAPYRPRRIA